MPEPEAGVGSPLTPEPGRCPEPATVDATGGVSAAAAAGADEVPVVVVGR